MCGRSHCLDPVGTLHYKAAAILEESGLRRRNYVGFSGAPTVSIPSYLHPIAISEPLVLNPRFQPMGGCIHGLVGAALRHYPNVFDRHCKLTDNIEEFLVVVR